MVAAEEGIEEHKEYVDTLIVKNFVIEKKSNSPFINQNQTQNKNNMNFQEEPSRLSNDDEESVFDIPAFLRQRN